MKTINLTLNGESTALSQEQAVTLFNALSDEMEKAGIDARQNRTIEGSDHLQRFSNAAGETGQLTDC